MELDSCISNIDEMKSQPQQDYKVILCYYQETRYTEISKAELELLKGNSDFKPERIDWGQGVEACE